MTTSQEKQSREPNLYCEHIVCSNGCTIRAGMCEACIKARFGELTTERARALAREAFILCKSKAGVEGGSVTLDFRTLRQAQEFHSELIRELGGKAQPQLVDGFVAPARIDEAVANLREGIVPAPGPSIRAICGACNGEGRFWKQEGINEGRWSPCAVCNGTRFVEELSRGEKS